jgi:hypothetical protein
MAPGSWIWFICEINLSQCFSGVARHDPQTKTDTA